MCLVGALVLVFGYEVYFYLRYLWIRSQDGASAYRTVGDLQDASLQDKPGVSVVICAHNEAYNLQAYIQSLLTQDYPEYEVIIVNDGSEDATQSVIEHYALLDSRVRTTYVPVGARVGSTKKLGLTLAAKAAKYDYLLLTDADCRPESKSWISEMMQGFRVQDASLQDGASAYRKEVVLGYGAYYVEDTMLNRVIQYETLFNGLHYLGAAVAGKPYMGVGRNLAYRKDTFFEHGGFSDMMNDRAGDDDLFVNKVATGANTAVVCSRESLTWSIPKTRWKEWWQQKQRHLSVSHSYSARSRRHMVKEPLARGLFYALEIVLFVVGSPLAMCAAYVMLLLRLGMQLWVLNRGARMFGQPRMGLEIMCYDILLPPITLAAMTGKWKGSW